jgi:predicted TIM-barrel fold metal-dependent hydrolase
MKRSRTNLPVAYLLSASVLIALSADAISDQHDLSRAQSVIDIHVHTAGFGAGGSGCYVAPVLRDSYKFSWYLRAFGVSREELEVAGDALVFQRISEHVGSSTSVQKAVVLAMDGVIDEHGELDKEHTQVYVPNEFVKSETDRYENLLFGASVNPYRPDATAILNKVKEAGAVLVKWIPAIMAIDPQDPRIVPFYEKLIELDLPLLVHVGQARSFSGAQDELGDPLRLKLALDLGVTVIAAHIATTGKNAGEGNFERLLPLFEQYGNLYTEISSLTQLNKLGYLYSALEVSGLSKRMLYGSDWPLQFFPLVSPWYQIGRISIGEIREVSKLKNPWDRDVALKRAMGVPEAVFTRGSTVLKIR